MCYDNFLIRLDLWFVEDKYLKSLIPANFSFYPLYSAYNTLASRLFSLSRFKIKVILFAKNNSTNELKQLIIKYIETFTGYSCIHYWTPYRIWMKVTRKVSNNEKHILWYSCKMLSPRNFDLITLYPTILL